MEGPETGADPRPLLAHTASPARIPAGASLVRPASPAPTASASSSPRRRIRMRLGRLRPTESLLLVCDMQTRLLPAMHRADLAVAATVRAIRGANALHVPVAATEQYPKGLGHTDKHVLAAIDEAPARVAWAGGTGPLPDKTRFSMLGEPGGAPGPVDDYLRKVEERAKAAGRPPQALLLGIEAHVCVAATALDLADRGWGVHVLADAVTSSRPEERAVALRRLDGAGGGSVGLSTVEAALFELVGDASVRPQFKDISKICQTRPEGGEMLGMG